MRKLILIVITILLISSASFAESDYFHDRADGWFWYINPEIKTEIKIEKQKTKQKNNISSSFGTIGELREEAKRLLEMAIMEPTDKNISAYLTIQKLILDKSEIFAHKWQEVVWTNPDLDYTAVHPISNTGLSLYKQEKNSQREDDLKKIAQNTGIFFIFSSTCQYCIAQSGILKTFSERYGFKVMPVTMDGKGLSEFPYPRPDNGISERLQVERTPSIFLAAPPDRITIVSSGLLTLDELEERVSTLGRKILNEDE